METDTVDLYHRPAVPIAEMSPMDPAVARDTAKISMIFWPADLLPQGCPGARVLVYGFDTHVTKYLSGPVNTTSILSHAKKKKKKPLIRTSA